MPGSLPLRITLAAGLLATAGGRVAYAQEKTLPPEVTPEIRSVLVDSQRVIDRLKGVLDLTTPQEQKQYDVLKEFIEVFLVGLDPAQPIRFDALTSTDPTTYRLYVPVTNFKLFWQQNLDPNGIPVKSFPKAPGLFRLGGGRNDAYDGYMRYDAKERGGYAVIAEKAGQIPANMPHPVEEVAPLLKAGYDGVVSLKNNPTPGPNDVAARHAHSAAQRDDLLDQLIRDSSETAAEFAQRKYIAGLQYDEVERLYAEAKEAFAGLSIAADGGSAKFDLRIEPLAGTPLAASVDAFGEQPSRFAGVPQGESASTTGRINIPLDEFRQKNFLGLSQRVREVQLERVAADTKATADQKAAATEFINGFFDRIDDGLKAGAIDGFVEMTSAGGASTLVGGLKSADGKAWEPLLGLLPRTRRASQVKTNIGEHEGVTLHELTLSKEEHPSFHELFGGGRLLAGTSADAIWYAAGPDGEAALKQAITQAAKPGEASPDVVRFRGELLPWLRLADDRMTGPLAEIRDMALAAFGAGGGRLELRLSKTETGLDGTASIEVGVMRLLGKVLADFSRENLDADGGN